MWYCLTQPVTEALLYNSSMYCCRSILDLRLMLAVTLPQLMSPAPTALTGWRGVEFGRPLDTRPGWTAA